jgi:lipoprotein-releasing system permease protein
MNWQLLISLRYLTSSHREKFISLISLISILGVAVGVAALIIVIGVMSGFDEDLKDKIVGTYSHIEALSDEGIVPTADLAAKIMAVPNVSAVSFFLSGQALARSGENVMGVMVKGVRSADEIKVNRLAAYMKQGTADLAEGGMIVGSELAAKLGFKIGDSVTLVTPASFGDPGRSGPGGGPFRVSGIFTSGMYDYDMNLVYLDIADAQRLFGSGPIASGAGIKVSDPLKVGETRRELQMGPCRHLSVRTWMDLNRNLIAALRLEKTVMFIILTLIVIVACFNIASGLIMTVLEKTRDIGILKAIGSTDVNIMAIFAMQGAMIGLIGTFIGASLGLGICWCLRTYRFITLPKEIYYIDRLPVKIDPYDISLIIAVSVLISFIASIYPSYRASRLDPVEALRYE